MLGAVKAFAHDRSRAVPQVDSMVRGTPLFLIIKGIRSQKIAGAAIARQETEAVALCSEGNPAGADVLGFSCCGCFRANSPLAAYGGCYPRQWQIVLVLQFCTVRIPCRERMVPTTPPMWRRLDKKSQGMLEPEPSRTPLLQGCGDNSRGSSS